VLARFLRVAAPEIGNRVLAVLPRTVAAALAEDLSLAVTSTPREVAEARRTAFAALRQALRARGLSAPQAGAGTSESSSAKDKGKVVAL
jgi:hypothetical protein